MPVETENQGGNAAGANNGGGNNAGGNNQGGNAGGDAAAQAAAAAAANKGASAGGENSNAAGGNNEGGNAAGGTPEKKTILAEGGSEKQVVVPADWPADWRTKLAGAEDKDGKVLKQLERFDSPAALLKSYQELQAKISSGQVKQPLPKDATPEQLAAFRKDNGIPEKAEGYDLKLPDGLVIGENDKPIVNNMVTAMHNMNMKPEEVTGILAAYYQNEKAVLLEREKAMADHKTTSDDLLHKEWGNEYRPNINLINNLVSTFTPETQSALAGAVGSDGMPLLNNPSFLKDMTVMARTINPVATLVPAGGGSIAQSVDDEITTIEKRLETDRDGYFKDQKAQDRYAELLNWRENNRKKSA